MLLDEFPTLGRLSFFESALAFSAGYGIKCFLICQSLNQLEAAYGRDNSIVDNCHVRMAYAANRAETCRGCAGEPTAPPNSAVGISTDACLPWALMPK